MVETTDTAARAADSSTRRPAFDSPRAIAAEKWDDATMAAFDRWATWASKHGAPDDHDRGAKAARLMLELGVDPPTVIAALAVPSLEHVAELDRLPGFLAKEELDPHVVRILDGVARIRAIRWHALGSESAEGLRRMILAVASDVRVVLVALAEHLEQLRSGVKQNDETTMRLAHEAHDVFAPLANRLGIWPLKWQLEDFSLRCLEPATYRELSRLLAETRAQRDAFIADVVAELARELEQAGIEAKIQGRPKHIYSIYKKMQRKQVGFDEIYDVSAVRVLVADVRDCYAVLGYAHGRWAPIPGEFDDYIAKPKANLYQSLHTAVVGPSGKTLEIQIRTHDMHDYAERGVAAHWAYKEGGSRAKQGVDHQFHLLRQLLDWQREVTDPNETAAALTSDILADRVYAFTPQGDVIDVPAGATALDFAYRVHTLVGHRCNGALVNGQIVTLDKPIRTGDRVQILTRKQPSPSRDWLNPNLGYVRTAGARQKIRQWFRKQNRDEAIAQGRDLLDKEFARLSVSTANLDQLATALNYSKTEDLLAAIGFGDLGTHRVGARALEHERGPATSEPELPRSRTDTKSSAARGVRVDGVGNVLSQPAGCCSPLPGDPVVGFISRGRGVVIHHRSCPNVRHRPEPERFLDIEWGQSDKVRYPVSLSIRASRRRGLLRDVVELVASCGAEVRATNSDQSDDADEVIMRIVIDAEHSEQIVRVIDRLARMPDVTEARRIRQ